MNGLLEKNVSESAPLVTLPIGTYREIPLTQGKVAIVDPEDYEWLSQFKWRAKCTHGQWYAVRDSPRGKEPRHTISMHRFIMQTPSGMDTDHRNSQGLDNRRENLRVCTNAENQQNAVKKVRLGGMNSSTFKGVCWCNREKKWLSRIVISKKRLHLGLFFSEHNAAVAYDLAALRYFGEFARTNFKKEGEKVSHDR